MKKKKNEYKTYYNLSLEELEQEIKQLDEKQKKRKRSVKMRTSCMAVAYITGCALAVAGIITSAVNLTQFLTKNNSMQPVYDDIINSQEYKDYLHQDAQKLTDQLASGQIDIKTYKEQAQLLGDGTYLLNAIPNICDQETINAVKEHSEYANNKKNMYVGGMIAMLSGFCLNASINGLDTTLTNREFNAEEHDKNLKRKLEFNYSRKKYEKDAENNLKENEFNPYDFI